MVTAYQPVLQSVTEQFFKEFATLLEVLAKYKCSLLVVDDVNIHLK